MPEDFTPQDGENGSSAFDEFLARYLDGERARASRSIDLTRFLSAAHAGVPAAGRARSRSSAASASSTRCTCCASWSASRRPRMPWSASAPTRPRSPAPSSSGCPQASDPADVDGAVITPSVQRALFHAFQVARSSGSTYVDPEHLFFALVLGQDAPAGQILAQAGVTADALLQGARETVTPERRARDRGASTDAAASETPMLDRFGTDLTALARDGLARPGDRPRGRDRADHRDPEPPHQEQPRAGRRGRRRQDRDRRGPRAGDRRRLRARAAARQARHLARPSRRCSPAPGTAATSRSA